MSRIELPRPPEEWICDLCLNDQGQWFGREDVIYAVLCRHHEAAAIWVFGDPPRWMIFCPIDRPHLIAAMEQGITGALRDVAVVLHGERGKN